MPSKRSVVLGLTSAAVLAAARILVPAFQPARAQMMGGDGMRGMMQRMMGDWLPPGLDPSLLPDPDSEGARLLQRYCTQCHNLPGPGMHTAEEWPPTVRRMEGHMGMHSRMMGGVDVPDAIEIEDLSDYLQANAQKPIDPGHTALDTAGGRAFRATCSQCHALPNPAQHTASEWPAVVARMQQNMEGMRRPVPTDQTLSSVVEFLQEHARPGRAGTGGQSRDN